MAKVLKPVVNKHKKKVVKKAVKKKAKKAEKAVEKQSGYLCRDPKGIHFFSSEPKMSLQGLFKNGKARPKMTWEKPGPFVRKYGKSKLPDRGACIKAEIAI